MYGHIKFSVSLIYLATLSDKTKIVQTVSSFGWKMSDVRLLFQALYVQTAKSKHTQSCLSGEKKWVHLIGNTIKHED